VTIRVFDETRGGDGAIIAKLASCSRMMMMMMVMVMMMVMMMMLMMMLMMVMMMLMMMMVMVMMMVMMMIMMMMMMMMMMMVMMMLMLMIMLMMMMVTQGFRDVTIRVFDETPGGDGALIAKLASCSRLSMQCRVWAVGADDRVSLLHQVG
jgi:hypothetical protein